jgi:hypothetical protein
LSTAQKRKISRAETQSTQRGIAHALTRMGDAVNQMQEVRRARPN